MANNGWKPNCELTQVMGVGTKEGHTELQSELWPCNSEARRCVRMFNTITICHLKKNPKGLMWKSDDMSLDELIYYRNLCFNLVYTRASLLLLAWVPTCYGSLPLLLTTRFPGGSCTYNRTCKHRPTGGRAAHTLIWAWVGCGWGTGGVLGGPILGAWC